MNGFSVCLDEIALEGLDGITISTLWRRIYSAKLCSNVDESYKEFLWRCISSCQDIEAYLLPTPREDIVNFEADSKIYPYHCINEAGVRGSCAMFQTRSLIDVSKISLQNAVETYGNTLVLVASQLLRNKVLLGPEFDVSVKIAEASYCLLEIIGRARKLGRLHSTLALQTLVDSRSLFAQVKTLLKLQLITKQPVVTRNRNAPSSIIYLAKYHTEHSYDSVQFKISEALAEAPDCSMPLESLCLLLGIENELVEQVVKDLSESGHVDCAYVNNVICQDSADIASVVDNTTDETQADSEGDKVIRLFRHFHNLNVEGDYELEDEEWIQPEKQELSINIPAEVPIMNAIYEFIASKGTDGASLTQCSQELSFPFFAMRGILKNLECLQVLVCKFEEVGNTNRNVYLAKHALSQDPSSDLFQAIGSSAMSHTSQPNEITSCNVMQTTSLPVASTPQTLAHPHAIPVNQPSSSRLLDVQHSGSCITETFGTQVTEDQMMLGTASSHSPDVVEITPHSMSANEITKPQTSQASHSLTSHTTNESENIVNNRTAMKGSSTPQSLASNVYDIKKPTKSRSEKIINTERFIRRKQYVLNLVKQFKVIEGKFQFQRAITMEEKKMGLNVKIDRKSVSSLLDRLVEDGLLNRVEMDIKVEDEDRKVEIFFDVDVQENSEEMDLCIGNFADRALIQKAKERGEIGRNTTNVISGLLPKMPRAELLHMFLFCVVYELNKPDVDLEAIRQKYPWAEHLKPEDVSKNMDKGWFTPFSVLRLLPVSLFFKLVDASFHNFVLQQYFDDPKTTHMLLKDLPPLARQILFDHRKSYFLFESFELLAHIGLITPTNKQIFFHDRDVACYLHPCTVVIDTRESEPSYNEVRHPAGEDFPEKPFTFAEMHDVDHYWSTVKNICVTTPLNRRRMTNDNKSRFYASFQSLVVDHTEVATVGKPRGNGIGAAGFDSRLYTHLLKKWQWRLAEKPKGELDSDVEDALDWQMCFTSENFPSEKLDVALKKKTKRKREKPAENGSAKKKRKVIIEEEKDIHDDDKSSSAQQNTPKTQENSENVNKEMKKRKKQKKSSKSHGHWTKNVHDERDEEALKRLQEKRNTFTPQQKKLLFICCLALRIVGKKSIDTSYSDWLWTRDILYKDNYESAKTKTALSISRKYRTMVKNAQTKTNLNICVADCMQEKEFQPYCNIGKNCNEAMFNELVELLKNKYSMENMVCKRLALPATVEEFQLQKNFCNSLDLENSAKCDEDIVSLEPRETSVADIRQKIIRDSIISALLLSEVNYPSHVAFRFLSQFTEEELIIAISVLKNGRVVVRKQLRYTKSGHDLANCTFSQMLSKHAQRTIDSHFPSSLLDSAKSFYDEVSNASKSSETLERFLPLKFSDSPTDGGKVYSVFSLLTCQRLAVHMHVPDVFLSLAKNQKKSKPVSENVNKELSTVADNEKNEERKGENVEETAISKTSVHSGPSESCKNGEEQALEETVPKLQTSGDKNGSPGNDASQISAVQTGEKINTTMTVNQGASQSTSQASHVLDDEEFPEEDSVTIPGNINRKRSNDMVLDVLCGIEDHLFGPLDVYANTPLYKVNLKPKSTFTCSMTTSDIDSVDSSGHNHIVVKDAEKSSLRDKNIYESYLEKIATYQRTGNLNRIQFSINPCNIRVHLLPAPVIASTSRADNLVQSVANHFKSNDIRMPETIEECVEVCSKHFGYNSNDCEALQAVYDVINNSKEIGMSSVRVNQIIKSQHSMGNFSTDGLIKVLEAFKLVYQVGFVEVCYVTKAFKKHWFLNVLESGVGSWSQARRGKKEQTSSGGSVGQEETNPTSCTKTGVPEEAKSSDDTMLNKPTSSNTPELTGSGKTSDEQNSKNTRNSSSQSNNSTQTNQ
jgi:general transcription factor 3C polypeptide 1